MYSYKVKTDKAFFNHGSVFAVSLAPYVNKYVYCLLIDRSELSLNNEFDHILIAYDYFTDQIELNVDDIISNDRLSQPYTVSNVQLSSQFKGWNLIGYHSPVPRDFEVGCYRKEWNRGDWYLHCCGNNLVAKGQREDYTLEEIVHLGIGGFNPLEFIKLCIAKEYLDFHGKQLQDVIPEKRDRNYWFEIDDIFTILPYFTIPENKKDKCPFHQTHPCNSLNVSELTESMLPPVKPYIPPKIAKIYSELIRKGEAKSKLIKEDVFWEIIEETVLPKWNENKAYTALLKSLRKRTAEEILGFQFWLEYY